MSHPIPLKAKRKDIETLITQLREVLYERHGTISICEAVGALELLKMELYYEQVAEPEES